jgi:hypothetical protein
LENLFTVERKSLEDIVGCCMGFNRDRFERGLTSCEDIAKGMGLTKGTVSKNCDGLNQSRKADKKRTEL